MNYIKFTNTWPKEVEHAPKAARLDIPEWYKKTKGSMDEPDIEKYGVDSSIHPVTGSIKKCSPVLDAISIGYLLYSPTDLIISQKNGAPYYDWFGNEDLIGWHPLGQVRDHPEANTEFIPKWFNPWSIETPKGYSCLFTHPIHRDNLPFKTLEGVVDTDGYHVPVALPFTLKDPDYEGLIPAGTPIAQVIPYKRDEWSLEFGGEKDKEEIAKLSWRLRKLKQFRYKNSYWKRKSYN